MLYISTIAANSIVGNQTAGILIIGNQLGIAVPNIGDFNRDDYDDIVITSILGTAGVIYVIYGGNSLPSTVYFDAITAQHGLKITSSVGSYAGISLSDAEDVDADGYDDLLIGSVPYMNGFSQQKIYLIFGRSTSIQLVGGGIQVSGTGDVNGDGFADMMLVEDKPSLTD
jgi:hypothetical protein